MSFPVCGICHCSFGTEIIWVCKHTDISFWEYPNNEDIIPRYKKETQYVHWRQTKFLIKILNFKKILAYYKNNQPDVKYRLHW